VFGSRKLGEFWVAPVLGKKPSADADFRDKRQGVDMLVATREGVGPVSPIADLHGTRQTGLVCVATREGLLTEIVWTFCLRDFHHFSCVMCIFHPRSGQTLNF
jgi:hypothetical protein